MTFRVQYLQGGHQTDDFPTERAAERFAKQKVVDGVQQLVIFEVGDDDE